VRNNPIIGATYVWLGLRIISKPRFRRFVLAPLLISMLVFSGSIFVLYSFFDWVGDWISHLMPSWLSWLSTVIWPFFLLAAAFIFIFGVGLITNLVAYPFNGLLSLEVEQYLSGKPFENKTRPDTVYREIARSVHSELQKTWYLATRGIPILLLMLVPGVNLAASAGWITFSAWMVSIQYADYPMSNHGLSFPQQRQRLAKIPLTSLGFGLTVMVGMLIPIFNFVVIPASVAGATALWVDSNFKNQLIVDESPTK